MAYQTPFNLPDEHMRLVGIIAAHWEALDVVLQRAVAEVLSLKFDDVRLLTENLAVGAKIDLIAAMASQLPDEHKKPINKALQLVRDAYGKRNAFVHAKWVEHEETDKPMRISIRTKGGKLVAIEQPTPASDLELAAQQICDAGEALVQTFHKYDLLKP